MIFKIVTLFLVAMGVLGMFGKLRAPKLPKLPKRQAKCSACGRPKIGKGPCPCGKDRG